MKKAESEVQKLKNNLTMAVAESLSYKKEVKILKKKKANLSKAKTQMFDELVKANAGTERLEAKLENEMSNLKDTFQQETDGIKSQIKKSMTMTI